MVTAVAAFVVVVVALRYHFTLIFRLLNGVVVVVDFCKGQLQWPNAVSLLAACILMPHGSF